MKIQRVLVVIGIFIILVFGLAILDDTSPEFSRSLNATMDAAVKIFIAILVLGLVGFLAFHAGKRVGASEERERTTPTTPTQIPYTSAASVPNFIVMPSQPMLPQSGQWERALSPVSTTPATVQRPVDWNVLS